MNRLDIIIYRLAIWRIKENYGNRCEEFEPLCVECRAGKTIKFLEEAIDLIKWSNKKDE